LDWSTFFFGAYCAFGSLAVWTLFSWHREASRLESGQDDYIEAEFYIVD